MRVRKKTHLAIAAVLFSVSFIFIGHTYLTQIAGAQDEPQQAAQAEPQIAIEPEALTVLKRMSDALSSLKQFSFDAEVNFDEPIDSGQMVQYGGVVTITVKRPNKVFAEMTGDRAQRKAWYNGKELTMFDQKKDFYGQLETPDTIDKTMDYLMETYDFTLPLADILHTDPYGSFSDGALEGVVIGDAIVRGKQCSHIAFAGELIDWQIWVSKEEPALPCKLVITYEDQPGVPQYQATFSNWNVNPEVPNSLFKAQIPEDAVKIDFIDMKKQRGAK